MQSLAENVIKYKPPILVEVRILWLIHLKRYNFEKSNHFFDKLRRQPMQKKILLPNHNMSVIMAFSIAGGITPVVY